MKYSIARTAVQNNFLMVSERGFFCGVQLKLFGQLERTKRNKMGDEGGGVNRNFELRYYLNSQ